MSPVKLWNRLIARYSRKRIYMLTYLAIIGLIAGLMHLLSIIDLYHSSVLYILVPYLVSVLITLFRPAGPATGLLARYLSHVMTVLVVFLSTSILIGEGFVCIIFFAPIYLFVVTCTYAVRALSRRNGSNLHITAWPVLIVFFSLEGTTPSLTLPRDNSIEVLRSTHLSIDQIKANLAKPFSLQKDRHWLLSIFPMPYQIDAGSLEPGDIHTVHTRYHRWFVANTHEGKAELLIEHVGPNRITTRVLSDSTYFTTYLTGLGTEINLLPNASGGTDIALRIHYRRNLNPAWYFHPLQAFGVEKMGQLIIEELIVRQPSLATQT